MSSTDIKFRSQVFDLVFHPTADLLFTGLLSGDIKVRPSWRNRSDEATDGLLTALPRRQAFNYSLGEPEQPLKYAEAWGVKPTKKSCRGLALDDAGDTLYSVGKERTLQYVSRRRPR
jgi:hypothetical protein